jgi:hypothetical protein
MTEFDDNESIPTIEVGIDYAFSCIAALAMTMDKATNKNVVGYQRARAAYGHLVEQANRLDPELLLDVFKRQALEKEAFELMNPPNTVNPTVNTANTYTYYITHT